MLWVIPVGFIGLGLLGQGLMAIGVIEEPAPTPVVSKSPEPEKPVVKPKPINPVSKIKGKVIEQLGTDRNVTVVVEKGIVAVGFDMEDNLFSDSRIRGGQKDILSILKVVKELKITNKTFIEAWFPLVDKYGNQDKYSVMYVVISNQTLNKMNLDNLKYIPENLEYVADEYYLHPAMLK